MLFRGRILNVFQFDRNIGRTNILNFQFAGTSGRSSKQTNLHWVQYREQCKPSCVQSCKHDHRLPWISEQPPSGNTSQKMKSMTYIKSSENAFINSFIQRSLAALVWNGGMKMCFPSITSALPLSNKPPFICANTVPCSQPPSHPSYLRHLSHHQSLHKVLAFRTSALLLLPPKPTLLLWSPPSSIFVSQCCHPVAVVEPPIKMMYCEIKLYHPPLLVHTL